MTEAQIRLEFSKAMTYPDLFNMAIEMKRKGESEIKINKLMTQRKNQLMKQTSKVTPINVTPIAIPSIDIELVKKRLNIEMIGNGNKIIFTGEKIILQ